MPSCLRIISLEVIKISIFSPGIRIIRNWIVGF
jgi:hypothetical protein